MSPLLFGIAPGEMLQTRLATYLCALGAGALARLRSNRTLASLTFTTIRISVRAEAFIVQSL